MMSRLSTLVERDGGHGTYLGGKLGDSPIVVKRDGRTRDGRQRWVILLCIPDQADEQERNRRGAHWRIERRKNEEVESLGGKD
jgi:hypothetical protein